jgi:hypothetical protein
MIEDEEQPASGRTAADDNAAAGARIDKAVLTLARLLARQIAREDSRHCLAANDNRAPETDA